MMKCLVCFTLALLHCGNSGLVEFPVKAKFSSLDGIPSVTFEHKDLCEFVSLPRPSVVTIRSEISSGLKKETKVSLLDQRHILLFIINEEDMVKTLSRESTKIDGVFYKIFRWSPDFDPNQDASVAPILVHLKGLPPHLFPQEFLKNIAKPIGDFLRVDNATKTLSNTTRARFCVEVDLRKALPDKIKVNVSKSRSILQSVTYEDVPKFCEHCVLLGHDEVGCRKLNKEVNKKGAPKERERKDKRKDDNSEVEMLDEMPKRVEVGENIEQLKEEGTIVVENEETMKEKKVENDVVGEGLAVCSNANRFEALNELEDREENNDDENLLEQGEIRDEEAQDKIIPYKQNEEEYSKLEAREEEIVECAINGTSTNVPLEETRENVIEVSSVGGGSSSPIALQENEEIVKDLQIVPETPDSVLNDQVNNEAEMLEDREAHIEVQEEEGPPSNIKPITRFKGSKTPCTFVRKRSNPKKQVEVEELSSLEDVSLSQLEVDQEASILMARLEAKERKKG